MIADTSFLIDIMINDPLALAKATELERRGLTVYVGAPTVFELYVGVSLTRKSEEEKLKITSVMAAMPQLPLDFQSAQVSGSIYGGKLKAGSRIDPEDAMLAGIAKVRGEAIVTRNVKHFANIEGLTVESY